MTGRSNALSFFAGLGQGYMQQEDKERDRKIQQQQLDYQNYERDRQKQADARADALRAGLSAASQAPVSYQRPDTADNRDVGTDPTAAPVRTVMPDTQAAMMGRQADVYARSGDAVGAAQLRGAARQAQLGDLQFNAAQRADLRQRAFEDLTTRVKTPQDVGDALSDSNGYRGKAKTVVAKDGSFSVYHVNDDGSTGSQLGHYGNVSDAVADMVAKASPESLLMHNHQQAVLKLEQERNAQSATSDQARLALERQRVALEGQRVGLEGQRVSAATRAPRLDPNELLPPAAALQLKGIEKRAESLQGVIDKARADGMFDPTKNPQHRELMTDLASLAQQRDDLYGRYIPGYKTAASDPIAAIDQAKNPQGQRKPVVVAPIMGDTSGQFGPPDTHGNAPPQMGAGAPPAPRLAPTDFVAATIRGLGRADPSASDATMRAATAGEQLAAAQQALRAAGASGDPNKISAAASAVQQASGLYQQSVSNLGGVPPEVVQQLRSQYGSL